MNDEATSTLSEKLNSIWNAVQKAIQGEPTELFNSLEGVILPALEALGILVAFYFGAKYLSKLLSTPIYRKVDQTLGRFVEKLVYRGMIGAGFIFVLHSFGVKSTSFAAVIAAAGFAIGLAFQGTLSNFASGVLLMVFRPFKVGDMVVAGGVTAKVHEIDLFTTVVDTPDNRRLIIPNSAVAGTTIENVTYHPVRRIEVPIGIAHSANIDATRASFWGAIESLSGLIYQDNDRKSLVHITGISNTSVDWMIRVWAPTKEFHNMRDQLLAAMKNRLDADGIKIAVPQMGVSMNEPSPNFDAPHPQSDRVHPRRTS